MNTCQARGCEALALPYGYVLDAGGGVEVEAYLCRSCESEVFFAKRDEAKARVAVEAEA